MDYEKEWKLERDNNSNLRAGLIALKQRIKVERMMVDKIISAPKTAKEAAIVCAIWSSRKETDIQCP